MMDLASILDDLPVAVWVGKVPDGATVYTNRAFERILGTPPVASSRLDDAPETYGLFGRDGRPYPFENLPFARVLATGQPVMVDDLVVRRPDGNINIRCFGSPVHDEEGALTHVIVAFLDITPEVAAQVERNRVEAHLRFACDHAPIAIWTTDADGVITMSEGAGLAALGLKSGQLVGQKLLDIYGAHPTIPDYIRRGVCRRLLLVHRRGGRGRLSHLADAAARGGGRDRRPDGSVARHQRAPPASANDHPE